MISEEIKEILKANWGDKANAMACYCEVKFMDSNSNWACYIYAMNPDDEDEIACIIDGFDVEACNWSLKKLYLSFNESGEYVVIDHEYRKIRASELFRRLTKHGFRGNY